MPITIVAGGQWGDEGKGRVVDLVASNADVVMRCQGGPNAGHTIVNQFGRFILHSVPSGIFYPDTLCVIGAGTVLNPPGLVKELRALIESGIDIGNVLISERAHLILPYHPALEAADEGSRREGDRIGPTGQGIGPTYVDKMGRCGLRACDLLDLDTLKSKVRHLVEAKNRMLAIYGHPGVSADDALADLEPAAEFLRPHIGDTVDPVHDVLTKGGRVLLEGQLGIMRDVDWGAYPYVTSSSPIPAGLLAGAGMPPREVDRVIGVIKAYTTAVGTGPFPTEFAGDEGDWLRERGNEYGATTGRPRRCGWFDALAVAWAVKVAGFTELALTKMDVLDGRPNVKIATAYQEDGGVTRHMPTTAGLYQVDPVYQEMPGWEATRSADTFDGLPPSARHYVQEVERLVGAPISLVSVGEERNAAITRG